MADAPLSTPIFTSLRDTGDPMEIARRMTAMTAEQLKNLRAEIAALGKQADVGTVDAINAWLKENKAGVTADIQRELAELQALISGTPGPSSTVGSADDATKRDIDNADRARAAAETALLVKFGRGLLLVSREDRETAGLDDASEVALQGVDNVLQDARIRALPIGELLSLTSLELAHDFNVRNNLGFGPNQERGLLFLALVCQRHFKAVEQLEARRGVTDVRKISIKDFLSSFQGISKYYDRFSSQFRDKLKGKSWSDLDPRDMEESLSSAFTFDLTELFNDEPHLAKAMDALGLPESERGAFALYYPVVKHTSINLLRQGTFRPPILFEGKQVDAKTYERFEKIILEMHKFVTNDAAEYVALYTHGETKPGGKPYAELIRQHLQNPEITAGDILDLYIAFQIAEHPKTGAVPPKTLDNASASGGLLMQMKVLGLLQSVDEDYGVAFRGFLMSEGALAAMGATTKLKLPPAALQALGQIASLADDVVQEISPLEWTKDKAWKIANFLSGMTGNLPFQISPEPIYYALLAGLGAYVIDWFNHGVGYAVDLAYKKANQKLEVGRSVGSAYADAKVPSWGRRMFRRFVPVAGSIDRALVEKKMNTMLKGYVELENAAGRPLTRTQIDTCVAAKKLAAAGKSAAEVKAKLMEGGMFTDEEASKLAVSSEIAAATPRSRVSLNRPGRRPLTADQLKINERTTLADLQRIAAALDINIDGKSEADARAAIEGNPEYQIRIRK